MRRIVNVISRQKPKELTITPACNRRYWLSVVVVIGAVLGCMVTAAVAFALPHTGKWEQQVFNPAQATSGGSNVSVEELCPTTPDFSFTVSDPSGDPFGFGHDIVSVSGTGDTSTFCLTVT
ncbi:MAG TPA: hypothetical protein VIG57_09860, partial [Candidatus Entotheonella sp.]